MATRAFPRGVERLVRRATIVNSADDIRRVTTQCLADGTPCVLELGSNIVCSAGFTIPGGLKAFSVDGAQRFKLIVSGDLPFLFYAKGAELNDGCPVDVSNVEILVKAGSSLTTPFVAEQFNIDFAVSDYIPTLSINNVVIDASDLTATCTNVVGHGSFFGSGGTRTARVLVRNLFCSGVGNLLADDDNLAQYISSTVDGFLSLTTGKPNMTLGQGAASARFTGVIENVLGEVDVSIGDNSTVAFIVVQADSYTGNNGDNTLLRVIATPRTVGPNEVDLDNISGGGGGGTFGQATATFTVGLDSVTVSVVDAGVSAGSNIVLSIGTATGREADEYTFAPVFPVVASVTAGVGFDIFVTCPDADADGAYLINYTRD